MPQRRRRRNNQNKSTRAIATKALSTAKKALAQPELKHTETVHTTTPPVAGFINQLSTVVQGDSNNERIGETIQAKSLHLRFSLEINASATQTQVRVIIFKWRSEQPANTLDVLLLSLITSFKNQDKRYQSAILSDRVYQLSDAKNPIIFVRQKIRVNKLISFPEDSSTSNMNSIWLLMLSDEATNTPALVLRSRLFYTDS